MTYIYALVDPFTKEIRYIGKSIRPKARLTNHCNEKSITWRTNWIRSVLEKGERPELCILQSLNDKEDWQKAEMAWIKKGREIGWKLTNCTDGGDGVVNLPGEIKQKMAQTWVGRKHSEKTKKLIGEKSKGRKHSEASKLRMKKLMTGRKITWKDKLQKAISKLSNKEVLEIKQMLKNKVSQYIIADIFGVHQGTISNINTGKMYTHLNTKRRRRKDI